MAALTSDGESEQPPQTPWHVAQRCVCAGGLCFHPIARRGCARSAPPPPRACARPLRSSAASDARPHRTPTDGCFPRLQVRHLATLEAPDGLGRAPGRLPLLHCDRSAHPDRLQQQRPGGRRGWRRRPVGRSTPREREQFDTARCLPLCLLVVGVQMWTFWWFFEQVITFSFLTDIAINFFTAFYDAMGNLVVRPGTTFPAVGPSTALVDTRDLFDARDLLDTHDGTASLAPQDILAQIWPCCYSACFHMCCPCRHSPYTGLRATTSNHFS